MFILVKFLVLVIIGGFVYWFGCSLLLFLFLFLFFYFNNFLKYFLNLLLFFILFLSFFLPFFLSHVADSVLLLQPGVRPEPLRWRS